MKGPRPLKGFNQGHKGGMGNIVKQAQKMQADMAKVQEEIAQIEADGSAGGDAVIARVNGNHELLTIKIKPEAVDPDDLEILEDLVVVAVNDAFAKVKAISDQKMGSITGGLGGLGGIPGLPF